MRVELTRQELAEAIESYVQKKLFITSGSQIEVIQAKVAKATVIISDASDKSE